MRKRNGRQPAPFLQEESSYPKQIMIGWLESLAITLITLVSGTLLFPFSFENLVILLSAAVVTFLTVRGIRRKRERRSVSFRRVVLTTMVIALALGWVALSPFVLLSEGRYVVVAPSTNNPFVASRIKVSLPDVDEEVQVTVITDPIRRAVSALLTKSRYFRLQTILAEQGEEGFYLTPPARTTYVHLQQSTSATSTRVSQLLNFFYVKPTIDMWGSIGATMRRRMGWEFNFAHSVSRTYRVKPWQELWHAVDCGLEVTRNDYKYVALLDYALMNASLGRLEEALSALYAAASVVPSRVESLRIETLAAHWSRSIFGGTFGELQSLSLYREAVHSLAEIIKSGEEHSRHEVDLLEWARLKILHRIGRDKEFFAAELALLDLNEGEGLAGELLMTEGPQELREKTGSALFKGGRYQHYMARLLSMTASEFLEESERASKDPEQARLFVETGIVRLMPASNKDDSAMVLAALAGAADASPATWRASFHSWVQRIDSLRIASRQEAHDAKSAKLELVEVSASQLELLGLTLAAKAVETLAENPNWRPRALLPPPKSSWWTKNFVDWFVYVYIVTGLPANQQVDRGPGVNIHLLARDNGGRGNPFVPGIALGYLIAKNAGAKEQEAVFALEFERAIGRAPGDYFAQPARVR